MGRLQVGEYIVCHREGKRPKTQKQTIAKRCSYSRACSCWPGSRRTVAALSGLLVPLPAVSKCGLLWNI